MSSLIGFGAFSVVEDAGDIHGRSCVVKTIPISYCDTPQAQESRNHAYRELLALHLLADAPQIISLVDATYTSSSFRFYLERMDITLQSFIGHADSPIPLLNIHFIANKIALALDACRGLSIVHRDVKPSNILISLKTGDVKLCDFGLARRLPRRTDQAFTITGDVGTIWYKPIEALLQTARLSFGIDIWSFGCVLAEMHRLRPLFAGSVTIQQLYLIQDCLGPVSSSEWPSWEADCPDSKLVSFEVRGFGLERLLPGIDPTLLKIISQCLIYNPEKRSSPRGIIAQLDAIVVPHVDFIGACNEIITKSSLTVFDLVPN